MTPPKRKRQIYYGHSRPASEEMQVDLDQMERDALSRFAASPTGQRLPQVVEGAIVTIIVVTWDEAGLPGEWYANVQPSGGILGEYQIGNLNATGPFTTFRKFHHKVRRPGGEWHITNSGTIRALPRR
jgi:hypothetical protein